MIYMFYLNKPEKKKIYNSKYIQIFYPMGFRNRSKEKMGRNVHFCFN